jgi:hypothetical protein
MSDRQCIEQRRRERLAEQYRKQRFRAEDSHLLKRAAKARKEVMIAQFLKNGHSGRHSPLGSTVGFYVNYCLDNGLAFRLTWCPRMFGFAVELIRDEAGVYGELIDCHSEEGATGE